MRRILLFSLALLTVTGLLSAQEKKKTEPLTPSARLAAAKTAFVSRAHGNPIPFDVISSALEGWGHFTLVNTPEKADVIIEITAPEDSSGVTVKSSTKPSAETGHMETSTSSTKQLSLASDVKMTVLDPRTKLPLWTATEHIRNAVKKIDRENNLVEAAQRIFYKFHDQIEPPQPKQE
jgi:hypothetical protein